MAIIVTIGFALLALLFIMQVVIVRNIPSRSEFVKLDGRVKDTDRAVGVMCRNLDETTSTAQATYRAMCDVHKAVTTGNANAELVAAVSAVAHGMGESTYRIFLELVTAVETNDVGRLSGVVRSAKHLCSQYETAEKAKLERAKPRKKGS